MVQKMVSPPNHVIARAPWHFGDFRNIFLPNIGEDQIKLYYLNAEPLALYHVVQIRPWLLHYVYERGPKVSTFRKKPLISLGLYISIGWRKLNESSPCFLVVNIIINYCYTRILFKAKHAKKN